MDIAIIPRQVSTEMIVDIPFVNSVSTSESGVAGRKLLRDIPLRTFTMTINPDDVKEVIAIILAARGNRWPVALRDWAANYELSDDVQMFEDDLTIKLVKNFTPTTGTRTYKQRVLILDETEIAFSVKVNGTPLAASPGWTITDPGIMTIPGMIGTETITVSGQYLVPCTFVDDMIPVTVHVDDLLAIQNMRLQEIGEAELIALTA